MVPLPAQQVCLQCHRLATRQLQPELITAQAVAGAAFNRYDWSLWCDEHDPETYYQAHVLGRTF